MINELKKETGSPKKIWIDNRRQNRSLGLRSKLYDDDDVSWL